MEVYEVKGNRFSIQKYMKSCIKQGVYTVRGTVNKDIHTIYVANNGHSWQKDLATDFNVSLKEYGEEPDNIIVACGVRTVPSVRIAHERACKSCRYILGKPEKSSRKNKDVVTVVSVPNIQDFSLNGMISAMKERQHEILEMYEIYENAVKALEIWDQNEQELKRLQEQVEKDREAVKFFMKEGV